MEMKKHVIALCKLIKEYGYWSKEVYKYNNELLSKYSKHDVYRIEISAKVMIETNKCKLINPQKRRVTSSFFIYARTGE